ncbi:MAG: hypothetical protein IIC73_08035 [Armatimonadetes bacterium]|nr:hypothetical protein [Armatimonadota bacterium]
MDTTDRPELRLWKVLWPVSILAGMAMLVRMMHHQLVMERTIDPTYEGWTDPRIALSVSIGVGLLASLLLISRITPATCKRWTIIVAAVVVAALLALSFVPDFEVFTPVVTVLAVPVIRGLRLPVLVPRGRKLLTWSATLVSFVAIPVVSVSFRTEKWHSLPGVMTFEHRDKDGRQFFGTLHQINAGLGSIRIHAQQESSAQDFEIRGGTGYPFDKTEVWAPTIWAGTFSPA